MRLPRSCVPHALIRVKGLPVFVLCIFGAVFAFAREWLGKTAMAMGAAWCIFLCKDLCDDPDRCVNQIACDVGFDLAEFVEPLPTVPGAAATQKSRGNRGNRKKNKRKD